MSYSPASPPTPLPTTALSSTPMRAVPPEPAPFEHGELVDVQNRFTSSWSSGFEIDEVIPQGDSKRLRLRRLSDRSLLPVLFPAVEVRRAS